VEPVKPEPAPTDPAPATPQPWPGGEPPAATGPAATGPDTPAAELASGASPVALVRSGADADEPAADGEQLGQRAERSPRDMAMSLAVLLVPIALVLIFYRFVLSGDAPVTVDTASTIQEAQSAKVFPIAVPKLGNDWHATSATWQKTATGGTLRIGYVDPDKDPIQLIESNVDSQTLARTELTTAAAQIGRFQTGGSTWSLYTGRPGEQGLVLFDQNRTIIIVGRAKAENLEALASALS
jgi:hypothetical protein